MIRAKRRLFVLGLVVAMGCGESSFKPTVESETAIEPGTICGTVVLRGDKAGEPPQPLKDVFVYIKEGLGGRTFETPKEPVVLDQVGFQFVPHVFGIRVGQTLSITSKDSSQHNVNCQPFNNPSFNESMFDGEVRERRFTAPEVMILFQCNFHPEMKAYAGVLEHPFFAVTTHHGEFAIKGLPAGRYALAAWQEDLGSRQVVFVLHPDRGVRVHLTYD